MKMASVAIALLFAVCLVLLVAACGGGGDQTPTATPVATADVQVEGTEQGPAVPTTTPPPTTTPAGPSVDLVSKSQMFAAANAFLKSHTVTLEANTAYWETIIKTLEDGRSELAPFLEAMEDKSELTYLGLAMCEWLYQGVGPDQLVDALASQAFLALGSGVGSDQLFDALTSQAFLALGSSELTELAGELIGALIGASSHVHCPEYLPVWEDFFPAQ